MLSTDTITKMLHEAVCGCNDPDHYEEVKDFVESLDTPEFYTEENLDLLMIKWEDYQEEEGWFEDMRIDKSLCMELAKKIHFSVYSCYLDNCATINDIFEWLIWGDNPQTYTLDMADDMANEWVEYYHVEDEQ